MLTNGFSSDYFTSSGTGNAGANNFFGTKCVIMAAETISAVWINFAGSPVSGVNFQAVIYDASHSLLKAQSIVNTTMVQGGNRFELRPPVALPAGTYYVGYIGDTSVSTSVDSSQTNSSWYVSSGTLIPGSPPNPLVGGAASNNALMFAVEFAGGPTSGFLPDNDPANTTIGGGGQTVTCSSTPSGARSVVYMAPQKIYAEVGVGGVPTNSGWCAIGIVSASFPFAYSMNFFQNKMCQVTDSTGVLRGSVSGTGVPFVNGDRIAIAYDCANAYLWFNRNGTGWIGNGGTAGDPVAGTNPISVGTPANWPVSLAAFGDTTISYTLYDTAASQAYVPPTGFTAVAPVSATIMNVTQAAVEEWMPIIQPAMNVTQMAIEEWGPLPSKNTFTMHPFV